MAANFTETQSFQRDQLFELPGDLSARIKVIEQWLNEKAAGEAQVQLLLTHKGIGILRLCGRSHPRRHHTLSVNIAYAGLDPLEKSSVGKIRFGSISKSGNPVLRHLLGQVAQVASRHDGELKAFYQRLANRHTKSIARVAATRKLLIRLFIRLRDGINYAEFKRRGSAVGMPVLCHGG